MKLAILYLIICVTAHATDERILLRLTSERHGMLTIDDEPAGELVADAQYPIYLTPGKHTLVIVSVGTPTWRLAVDHANPTTVLCPSTLYPTADSAGLTALSNQQWQAAADYYAAIQPATIPVKYARIMALDHVDKQQAIALAQALIDTDPTSLQAAQCLRLIVRHHVKNNDYEPAIALLQRRLPDVPHASKSRAELLLISCLAYYRTGDIAAAERATHILRDEYPEHDYTQHPCRQLPAQDKDAAAEAEPAKATPIDHHQIATDLLAKVQAQPLHHRTPLLRMTAAKHLIMSNNHLAAIDQYQQIIALANASAPLKEEALYWLAHCYRQTGKMAESNATSIQLTTDFPTSRWAKFSRQLLERQD